MSLLPFAFCAPAILGMISVNYVLRTSLPWCAIKGVTPGMPNVAFRESTYAASGGSGQRRILIVADAPIASTLERQLVNAGYAIRVALSTNEAPRAIAAFAPDVLLIEITRDDSERATLARRLRAEPATFALPLIFLYHQDERTLRNGALSIGIDDYFPLVTPSAEMCARLDALFWRAEAGRRVAPIASDPHAEIDNFLLLLDTVRANLEEGAEGSLGIIEASARHTEDSGVAALGRAKFKGAERQRPSLAEAHGFMKLNLRRIDNVVFYGPTLLLVYLPRMAAEAAQSRLAHLYEEFRTAYHEQEIAIGLAAFPSDSRDIEMLIAKAEAALKSAQMANASTRVVAYHQMSAPALGKASQVIHPAASASVELTDQPTPPSTTPSPRTPEPATSSVATTSEDSAPTSIPPIPPMPPTPLVPPLETPESTAPPLSSASNYTPPKFSDTRVLREKRADDVDSTLHPQISATLRTGYLTNTQEAQEAAEACARERERRARGEVMPRRLLLTISDPARMAQLNLLIRSAGYEVRAAFDAQQALNLLRIERPDVVVFDYELQGMDGTEALRRLRQQSGGRMMLPVVLLVPEGEQAVEIRDAALETGARGVVALPIKPSEFLDAVRTAGTVE